MKHLLTILGFLTITLPMLATATTGTTQKIERISSCNSHYIRTSGFYELNGVDLKDMTKACSLAASLKEGHSTCEQTGKTLKKAAIGRVSCRDFNADITCETPVSVECE